MQIHRKALPSEFGSEVIFLTVPGGTLTANDVTRFRVPCVGKTLLFRRLTATHTVAPVDADGDILATVVKVTGTSTRTTISENLDLAAITALKSGSAKFKAGLAPSAYVVKAGDGLEVAVTNDSAAINTQATEPYFTLEFFVLN